MFIKKMNRCLQSFYTENLHNKQLQNFNHLHYEAIYDVCTFVFV